MTSFRSIASKAQTGKQYAEIDAMKRLEELSAMKREEIEPVCVWSKLSNTLIGSVGKRHEI